MQPFTRKSENDLNFCLTLITKHAFSLMKTPYLLQYDLISGKTIDELVQLITEIQGLKVKDCRISDLIFYNDEPIYSGNGVYIFKSADRFIYVGCCVARNFVERIPAHFDLRVSGWFNSLLDNMRKVDSNERSNETLTQAARLALESYSIVLINFPLSDYTKHVSNIKILETLLRKVLNPYNTLKSKPIDRSIKLADYFNIHLQLKLPDVF